MSNFNVGDVVYLPSDGGILMTVNSVQGDYVGTAWFDDESHLQSGSFLAAILLLAVVKPVEQPPAPAAASAR